MTTTSDPDTIVQSWVSVELAQEAKAHAEAEDRSLSSLIRLALQDRLQASPPPTGEGAGRGGPFLRSEARRGAGAQDEED